MGENLTHDSEHSPQSSDSQRKRIGTCENSKSFGEKMGVFKGENQGGSLLATHTDLESVK